MDSDYDIDYSRERDDDYDIDYSRVRDDVDDVDYCRVRDDYDTDYSSGSDGYRSDYHSYERERYEYDFDEKNVPLVLNVDSESHGESDASSGTVTSLLDLSAKVASRYYCYNHVERFYQQIPEPAAKKFMLWSFPRTRTDIVSHIGQPYSKAYPEIEHHDVMQIGFQVSGYCIQKEEKFHASLYIDRCVITSAYCSCSSKAFCEHIKSLALYRFDHADTIPIHLPISDSLNTLNREQLLYLVKYIINKHSNFLLLNAQDITNELLDENSEKNKMPGAPDPTVGGDVDNDPVWLTR